MAIINPTYNENFVKYRFADKIELNGLSNYNFFYSPISKEFLLKESKGKLTKVTIDLPMIDNLIKVNIQSSRAQ